MDGIRREGHGLVVEPSGAYQDDDGGDGFIGVVAEVEKVSLAALRRALGHRSMYFTEAAGLRGKHVIPEPIGVAAAPGGISLLVSLDAPALLDRYFDNESQTEEHARRLIAPLLRGRGQLHSLRELDFQSGVQLDVRLNPRRLTVGMARDLGWSILRLVQAVDGGRLDTLSALTILQAGCPAALLGQREGQWIDVKSQPYMESSLGELALAGDVAAFANGEGGGLIVVGIGTKKTAAGEVLNRLHPASPSPQRRSRYLAAIDRLVFPAVRGLLVESSPVESGEILWIYVPDQPDQLRPFMVRGAQNGDRIRAVTVTVPRRRDDHALPMTVEEIHALVVAGRAFLRGANPAGSWELMSPTSRDANGGRSAR